jgi:hypothetical protein
MPQVYTRLAGAASTSSRAARAPAAAQGVVPVRRHLDIVAVPAKHVGNQFSDRLFIIDDQDECSSRGTHGPGV